MKKLLTLTFLAIPTLTFAGGAGTGIDLSDYNIVEPSSAVESSTSATTIPQVTQPTRRTTTVRTRSTRRNRSARRGYGFRLSRKTGTRGKTTTTRRSRSTRGAKIYTLNGVTYNTYWEWIRAYRAANNDDTGITRITTSIVNYGNAYDLANGLEPIDPKDNTYRGLTREEERQAAAQLKLMRLRGLR